MPTHASRRPSVAVAKVLLIAALVSLLILVALGLIAFINFGKAGSTPALVPSLSGTTMQFSTVTVEHKTGKLADATRVGTFASTNEALMRSANEHTDPFAQKACRALFSEGDSRTPRLGIELELVSTGWPFRAFAARTLNDLQRQVVAVANIRYEVRSDNSSEWSPTVNAVPGERVEWRAVLQASAPRVVLGSRQLTPFVSWRNLALNFLIFWVAILAVILCCLIAIRVRRHRNCLCLQCGYGPLLSTQSKCPECGCASSNQPSPA